jgi:NitT/TauT family transport system permease protein
MAEQPPERPAAVDTLVADTVRHTGPAVGPASSGAALPQRLRLSAWLAPLIAIAIAALIWELYAGHNRYVIPTIPGILQTLKDQPGIFWHNGLITLREIGIGAACGMGAAMVLAILMVEVPILERALMPMAVVLNVTPIVAIAPALVVAFGFGNLPKYLVTAIIVFFPFLVNVLTGLRNVDPQALDVMNTLHASRWERFYHLRLPSCLPFLFAAARICLPLSVVGAVVAEFSASGQLAGLGALIQVSAQQSDLKTIWASILILAVLGVLFTVIISVAQAKILWWDAPNRRS